MPTAVEDKAFVSAFALLPNGNANGIIFVGGLGALALLPAVQPAPLTRTPAR